MSSALTVRVKRNIDVRIDQRVDLAAQPWEIVVKEAGRTPEHFQLPGSAAYMEGITQAILWAYSLGRDAD